MAFEREMGRCCCFIPLKLGVGLICMLVFSASLFSLLAIFTGDIRFQPNGYALTFYWFPPVIGAFGIFFGFIGLLGVYDDKRLWLNAFAGYMVVRLLVMVLVAVADYFALKGCDTWLLDPANTVDTSPQMYAIATAGVCHWARWSYFIGASIDFVITLYLTYCVVDYAKQISKNPPYGIDFGLERYDVKGRWRMYQARPPRDAPNREVDEEEEPINTTYGYGSFEDEPATYEEHTFDGAGEYGPDGMKLLFNPAAPDGEKGTYGPDGVRRINAP